ncbi:MAG: preprotein translocase subunit SecG [Verrucomicrobiales bacterium]
MAPFFIGLLSVLLGIVSVLIVLVVLMQRPKQEGLGAAFGGGMTDQMFGAQTTNVLQKGTVYLAVMFFVFSLILSVLTAKSVRGDSDTIDEIKDAPAPAPITETLPGIVPGGSETTPPVQVPTSPLGGGSTGSPEPGGDAEPAETTEDSGDDAAPDATGGEATTEETPSPAGETSDEVPAVIEEETPGE